MRRMALALPALTLFCGPMLADDVADLSAVLGRIVGGFEAVSLYQAACDARDPDGVAMRRDVVAGWRFANDSAGYERLMAGIAISLPEVEEQFAPQREALAQAIADDLDTAPAQCRAFGVLLDEDQFDLEADVRRALRLAWGFDIAVPDAPQIVAQRKDPETITVMPISQLSVLLAEVMEEVGSAEGAAINRDLREAREARAEDWMEADGIQVLYGRVTDEDEMREWRGENQSVFSVTCRSFSEDAHETRMATMIGQDMVLVGTPRWVIDFSRGQGNVALSACSLFTLEEAGRPVAQVESEAGWLLRGLEFDEAYAGPGQGIAPGNVDRVLYDASFDMAMDGFGNGYVDRQEDIYVLLRDGTAYRHDWGFPFTDLAVDLSRHREPERWFSWREENGAVVLSAEDGRNMRLEGAQRLQPMGQASFDADYYYLQVGMGGARQDRRYAFSADGNVRYTRGGFVAGNVGTSFITIVGPDDPVTLARYRFEDYALILETSEGEERHFFAVPESADGALPDTVLIGGEAYWMDDE